MSTLVLSSAPGKVILFAEHAVVYGVLAISAALSDLRIFVSVQSAAAPQLEVVMHDIKMAGTELPETLRVSCEEVRSLCSITTPAKPLDAVNPREDELALLRHAFVSMSPQASQGVMAICYLVSRLLPELMQEGKGLIVNVKSVGLPIGAGLGSSAAFSVALSGALLQYRQKIYNDVVAKEEAAWASLSSPSPASSTGVFDFEKLRESSESCTPPETLLPVLNAWAYAAEVVIHGSPSGLDNTTSCYGGALKYERNTGKFDRLAKLPDIKIMLTNTKVPRSTKELVAGVRVLHDRLPEVIKPIFASIEGISRRFLELLEDSGISHDDLVAEIGTLFRVNQDLLNAIGVGHPSLNSVTEHSRAQGFACKLTGAGGGGCAITLLDNSENLAGRLEVLEGNLHGLGFETFNSGLAGDGVRWHNTQA